MYNITQTSAAAVATLLLLGGCSSLLPVTHSNTTTFQTFDAARDAVVALVPMKTSLSPSSRNCDASVTM